MIREMLDLMLPRTCLVCGRQLGAREEHLCLYCAADLPLTGYWELQHNPMADQFNALLERYRPDGEPMDYAYAAALLYYHRENPYKCIPRALKYEGMRAVGRHYGSMLGEFLAGADWFRNVDLVIPVPLHPLRKWRRGYNQAEVIAARLARSLGAPLLPRALNRVRSTRSQTRFSAGERIRNVEGVFRVRKPFTARHVLLVDDTFTTGATLAACYRAVRAALGPSVRISIATLSVVEA